ncbi:hypothetical protein CFP56_006389 [Quercus suber]|uniref:Uncharacterized protein n=1 Tax=Quercus suber TaxID=58331 RepID=A0AAW0L970_QUESU
MRKEGVGEEVEVLGRQSEKRYSPANDGNRRQKEGSSEPVPTNKETGEFSASEISASEINAVRDSRGVTDFQETLRGIDAAISKFDKTELDPKSNGPASILGQVEAHTAPTLLGNTGCALSEDEVMLTIKSPQENVYKARGWKRFVNDRPHAVAQITPTQRKRAGRRFGPFVEIGHFGMGRQLLEVSYRRSGEWYDIGSLAFHRGVANYDWLVKFPAAQVRHFHCFSSDHRPIKVVFDPNSESRRWFRKPFRFEEMWLSDRGCSETEGVGEEVEVLGRQSEKRYSPANDGNRRQKEGSSEPVPQTRKPANFQLPRFQLLKLMQYEILAE